MASLNQEQLRRLARLGAMSRLEQLRAEEAGIRAEFPELFGGTGRGRGRGRGQAAAAEEAAPTAAGRRRGGSRKRRPMSAAEKKAVSERMRKYWADRRKQKSAK
jgi:hypothetical protein